MLTSDERERLRDEISSKREEIAQLQEAIEFRIENQRRGEGFGDRDLETNVSELRTEISQLQQELQG